MQAVVGGMKSEKFGRIINVISTSVKQPIKGLGVSNTIRGAVASWAKTLAGELGPFGITVNNILPGTIDTDRLKEIVEGKAQKTGKTVAEVIAHEIAEVPLGRFGKPEEIAQVTWSGKLLGAGDMLYLGADMSKPVRLQSAYISESEVKKVAKYLADTYKDEIMGEINLSGPRASRVRTPFSRPISMMRRSKTTICMRTHASP